jgi:hypothetical protein
LIFSSVNGVNNSTFLIGLQGLKVTLHAKYLPCTWLVISFQYILTAVKIIRLSLSTVVIREKIPVSSQEA